MVSTTDLKQRQDIPALSSVKKECEEILKQHAEGKIKKKVINAKVDTCLSLSDRVNEPIEMVLDPVDVLPELEEEGVESRLLGQQHCNQ